MESICSSETLVDFHWTTWHCISEDRTLHSHYCQNLKSNKVKCLLILDSAIMYRYPSFYEHSLYEFSLDRCHFHYNKQLIFIRNFYAKAGKYIPNRWGEADFPTHVYLPPSQSVHTPHCDHTESSVFLMHTFYCAPHCLCSRLTSQ
jgi:hypothetical protein